MMRIAAFTAAAFACFAPPALAQGNNGCNEALSQHSVSGDTRVTLTFKNDSGDTVDVVWINYQGGPQLYKELENRQQFSQETFVTHPWVVMDLDGHCLRGIVATSNRTVIIESDIELELMASRVGYAADPSPGHAFLCIKTLLQMGTREDCYGFYRRDAGAVAIGGPQIANGAPDTNPAPFPDIAASFTGGISEHTQAEIMTEIGNFGGASYPFTDANCIAFIDRVVHLAGWHAPDRRPAETPADYVRMVARLNDE